MNGGMEVEHLKSRPADSISSSAVPSLVSSAASSSTDIKALAESQTQLNSQGPHPVAPFGQPQAAVADRYTLSVPPSEKLRIVRTVPDVRPGLLSRHQSLDSETKADAAGEVDVLVGAAA